MTSPYRISEGEPAVISFSGGRTSGFLLWETIMAYGGTLPPWVRVIFCNTGREMPQTLDYVHAVQVAWSVPILWLEFRDKKPGFEVVTYETASRNGEPFLELIQQVVHRNDGTQGVRPLPNPVSRVCTTNLKTRLKKRYLNRAHGIRAYHMAIGFRADEGNRVARGFKYAEPGETLHYPLHAAGVTKEDVLAFWGHGPNAFDLALPVDKQGDTIEGNCDLCFMKSAKKVSAIGSRYPDKLAEWAAMEAIAAHSDRPTTFRNDRPSYGAMLEAVRRGEALDYGIFDDLTTCSSYGCTD